MNTLDLLTARQKTHGDFTQNAIYGQEFRALCRSSPQWSTMPSVHREALDMMASKLSRILSGQSEVADHWQDIAGYATLALGACRDG